MSALTNLQKEMLARFCAAGDDGVAPMSGNGQRTMQALARRQLVQRLGPRRPYLPTDAGRRINMQVNGNRHPRAQLRGHRPVAGA